MKKKYPLPRIDDLFNQVKGATIFYKIDLCFGYHQIRIRDDDICKIASRTHYGHCEFLILRFWLTNTLDTFMFLRNSIFHPYLDKFVLIFIDENLIYSKNMEEHKRNLQIVLPTLQEHQLYSKYRKCELYK